MEIYKKYGKTFKILREQNGLSMSSFKTLGISKSTISNFEAGKSMMGFDKVLYALEFMGTNLAEYESFLNNYSINESESIINDADKAIFLQDKKGLEELYYKAYNANLVNIALVIKKNHSGLSEKELENVLEYLNSIEIWGDKDLWLVYNVIDSFGTHDILKVLDNLLNNEIKLLNLERYNRRFIMACCQGILTLTARGYKEYSEHILNRLIDFNLPVTMYQHNIFNFTRGIWTYEFEDESLGKKIIENSLEIFKELALPIVVRYYENIYTKYLK